MKTVFNFKELKAAQRLPSPSGTALAIMRLAQQPDASVEALSDLVKTDPALTGRILTLANSSAAGARRPIATINDAVVRVGMLAVRNFALSLSVLSRYRGGCPGFDYEAYWSQALAMAVACAVLVGRERTIPPEEAFTLGLLSDIGRLALATAWSDQYGDCLHARQDDELLRLERERFCVDHRELTALLLEDWGLPSVFTDALNLSYEMPISTEGRIGRLAQQLAFARCIARYCVADDAYRTALVAGLEEQAGIQGVDGDEIMPLVKEIEQAWHQWGHTMEVGTDQRQPAPPTSAAVTGDDATSLDILLVDDDPIQLTRLSKQLMTAGHRLAVCRDGDSALRHVIEHAPQIVITDWHMQPMDGLTLCRALRQSAVGKTLYLIMLTASETEDELVEAFDSGIDDYVTKPVNLRILLARLRAGQRIVALQREVAAEQQAIQRYSDELALANRRLIEMANTDVLTGLPNRRYALQRLSQEWDAMQRYHRPLSMLILDLDHFKSINDTLGHDAGDIALAHAAKIIKSAARSSDIACRLGGEEFLVIAINTDGTTAARLAERIRRTLEVQQPRQLALAKPLTVSIGVAGSTGMLASNSSSGWHELMKTADKALYQVKSSTRNAVRLASALV